VRAVPSLRRGTRLATIGAVLSVLIADDEPHVVELVRVTLEDERVRVFEAADGETALSIAEALSVDLVFLDVHLPDLSGLEVCRRLRANPLFTGTRIVMLTAAAQQDDVTRGLAAGADEYLTKPFSPVRLLSLVERLLPRVAWHLE
jgi:DNA-binding response OmpR family regulator